MLSAEKVQELFEAIEEFAEARASQYYQDDQGTDPKTIDSVSRWHDEARKKVLDLLGVTEPVFQPRHGLHLDRAGQTVKFIGAAKTGNFVAVQFPDRAAFLVDVEEVVTP